MSDTKTRVVISAVDDASNVIEKLKGRFEGLTAPIEILQKSLAALGAAAGLTALGEWIAGGVEKLAGLNDLSEKTGVAVEALSRFQQVASLSNTPMEAVAGGLGKLSKAMLEAATTGGQSEKIFNSLGVAFKEGSGLRDAGPVMEEIAQKMATMESGTQRTAYATALFGKSGKELIPFLLDMVANQDILARVTGDSAESADQLEKSIAKLKLGMGAVQTSVAAYFVPAMNDVVAWMIKGQKEGGLLMGILAGVGASMAKMTGQEINPLKLAEGDVTDNLSARNAAMARLKARQEAVGANPNNPGDIAYLQTAQAEVDKYTRRLDAAIASRDKLVTQAAAESASSKLKTNPALPPDTGKAMGPDSPLLAGAKLYADLLKTVTSAEEEAAFAGMDLTKTQKDFALLQESDFWKTAAQGVKDWMTSQVSAAVAAEKLTEAMKRQAETEKAARALDQHLGTAQDAYANQAAKLSEKDMPAADKARAESLREVASVAQKARESMANQSPAFWDNPQAVETFKARLIELADAEQVQRQTVIDLYNEQERLNASFAHGADKGMQSYLESVANVAAQSEKLMSDAFKGMEDALVTFVKGGKLDFKSLADNIITDLIRIQIQQSITGPLAAAMKGGNLFADIGSFFGFGGGKAGGGPVSAGTTYLVGEAGPELFTAGASGSITPNNALGGGGVVVNVVEAPGKGGQVSQSNQGGQNIITVLVEQVKNSMASDVRRGGDFAATLEGAYGLNRAAGAMR